MRLIDADTLMDIYANRLKLLAMRYGVDSTECGVLAGAMKLLETQRIVKDHPIRHYVLNERFPLRIKKCPACGAEYYYFRDCDNDEYCEECGERTEEVNWQITMSDAE